MEGGIGEGGVEGGIGEGGVEGGVGEGGGWENLLRPWRVFWECDSLGKWLRNSLVPSPSPHMRERGSGVLNDFSCQMGRPG